MGQARRVAKRPCHGIVRDDAEPDRRAGLERYEHRGGASSMWEDIKEAVRDAWDRVVGTPDTSTNLFCPSTSCW